MPALLARGKGMNKIPFIGWLLTLTAAFGLSVPMWFFWTYMGIGAFYFDMLPMKWQVIEWVDFIGLFMVAGCVKSILPSGLLVSVSNNTTVKED